MFLAIALHYLVRRTATRWVQSCLSSVMIRLDILGLATSRWVVTGPVRMRDNNCYVQSRGLCHGEDARPLQPPTTHQPPASGEPRAERSGQTMLGCQSGNTGYITEETIRRDHNIQSSECEKHPSVTDIFLCR